MKRNAFAAVLIVAFVAFLWLFLRSPIGDVGRSDVSTSALELKRDVASVPAPRRRAADAVEKTTDEPAPWEILVLGAHDAPLAGVTAKPVGDERTDRPRTTGADGLVTLQRLTGQASLDVDLAGTAPPWRVTLTEPRTVVHIPDALPLVVRLVDGETGAAIAGGAVRIDERNVAPAPDGDGFRLGASPVHRGATADLDVDVTAPKGYVGFKGPINALVGTFTTVAELTILLWPELDLSVEVRDVNGSPAAGASVASVKVDGQQRQQVGPKTDAAGRAVLHGVPFIRNARVAIGVERPDRPGSGEATLGSIVGASCIVPITLIEPPSDWAPSGAYEPGRMWSIRHYVPPTGDAVVVVQLRRADGAAAVDLPVGLTGVHLEVQAGANGQPYNTGYAWRLDARTDAAGRATFSGVPGGECDTTVCGEGITAADRKIVAVSGATTTVSIRPTAGLASTITVLDETNRPLPCAAVSIMNGERCVQDESGVQQLVLRADVFGRCRLHGLGAGKLWAHVQWESRSGNVEFTAGEAATVVLPARTE